MMLRQCAIALLGSGMLVLAGCSKTSEAPPPAPENDVEAPAPLPEKPVEVAPPAPEPAPPAPKIVAPPPEEPTSADTQMLDDADATGLTARASRDEDAATNDATGTQTEQH